MNIKNKNKIKNAVKEILIAIGENPKRLGLIDTPKRVANMYEEICSSLDLNKKFNDYVIFENETINDMIIIKNIEFFSMCEHHLLPFYGKVNIAYISNNNKVLGLSKIPRLVEYYSKKLNIQENLTIVIAKKLFKNLNFKGIAVHIKAKHLCMMMRGIKSKSSIAETFCFLGLFKNDIEKRKEFLNRI